MRMRRRVTDNFFMLMIPVICLAVTFYFGYSGIFGERGIVSLNETRAELAIVKNEFDRTRAERKVLRRGDSLEWTDALQRHQLRIRVKRLRYTCEPFAALFPRGRMRRYLERLESLQDILGELNDIAVGQRLLHELVTDRDLAAEGFMRGWFAAREELLLGRLAAAWRSWRKTKRPW